MSGQNQTQGSVNSHVSFILDAKRLQKEALENSNKLSTQLKKNLEALSKSNSSVKGQGCTSILDKISTIHELDKNIEMQVNSDIGESYHEMVSNANKLKLLTSDSMAILHNLKMVDNKKGIDIQSKIEQIDKELRILETTLVKIKENRINNNLNAEHWN